MFELPKYGKGICLGRLAALLDRLEIDRDRLQRRAVVVTGSNGKGSTAAMCGAIGRGFGLRSGLFTSPHLYRINERFQIDGVAIDDTTLARLQQRVAATIGGISRQTGERFGAFEAQFALACLYFQEAACDFAVFEAGIGGRFDPVRLAGALCVGVTSVDLEHVQLLGDTLELIATDKSDACAAGGTIVYGENCRGLRPLLLEYNRFRDVECLFVRDEIGIRNERLAAPHHGFDLQSLGEAFNSLAIGLPGAFQLNNAAIAVALFQLWLRRTLPDAQAAATDAAVRNGLRDTRWPGRLEVVSEAPLAVIDVGHTPDGIRQALASLHALHGGERWILVLGVSQDKKADDIVAALAPAFDRIICTAARHKGAPPQKIADAARRANPTASIEVAATIADAAQRAVALAESSGRKIYAAGGLFLAIEFATVLRGGRAEDLDFF